MCRILLQPAQVLGWREFEKFDACHQPLVCLYLRLGTRLLAAQQEAIAAINSARIAGKSHDEIRQLVVKLEAARKNAA
jgi:prophage regulatory protein